jgi:hypothetical protein
MLTLIRFLRGTWTAEVNLRGSVVFGNGFLIVTNPNPGTLLGRFYENVTDSVDVKTLVVFQVTCSALGMYSFQFLFVNDLLFLG